MLRKLFRALGFEFYRLHANEKLTIVYHVSVAYTYQIKVAEEWAEKTQYTMTVLHIPQGGIRSSESIVNLASYLSQEISSTKELPNVTVTILSITELDRFKTKHETN